jgi:hypothetical protein
LAQNTSTGARSAEAKRRGDRAEAVAEGPRETSEATAALGTEGLGCGGGEREREREEERERSRI